MPKPHLPYSKYHLADLKRRFILSLSSVFFISLGLYSTITLLRHSTLQTTKASTFNPEPQNPPPLFLPPPSTVSHFSVLVKFQGVTSDVGPIKALFQLIPSNTDTPHPPQQLTFYHTKNGIFKAAVPVDTNLKTILSQNPRISFTIKGEKHLSQVFNNVQILDTASLDLTQIPLIPGDLPTQDGRANQTDLQAVLQAFSNPNQLEQDLAADVNFDGVVNTLDLNLIINTINSQPDEFGE